MQQLWHSLCFPHLLRVEACIIHVFSVGVISVATSVLCSLTPVCTDLMMCLSARQRHLIQVSFPPFPCCFHCFSKKNLLIGFFFLPLWHMWFKVRWSVTRVSSVCLACIKALKGAFTEQMWRGLLAVTCDLKVKRKSRPVCFDSCSGNGKKKKLHCFSEGQTCYREGPV